MPWYRYHAIKKTGRFVTFLRIYCRGEMGVVVRCTGSTVCTTSPAMPPIWRLLAWQYDALPNGRSSPKNDASLWNRNSARISVSGPHPTFVKDRVIIRSDASFLGLDLPLGNASYCQASAIFRRHSIVVLFPALIPRNDWSLFSDPFTFKMF